MEYSEFADLSLEHQAFLDFLDKEEKAAAEDFSLERWTIFARLLEKLHHAKEESFLFPLLLGTESLKVGGPKCMTFFTPRVLGAVGWLDAFHDLNASLPAFGNIKPYPQSDFRREAFESNSMLKIPLEDHILGARALTEILQQPGHERPSFLIPKFAAHLRDHIRREEECLFELFRKNLSEEQKLLYAERAKAFDEQVQTKALLNQLSQLDFSKKA